MADNDITADNIGDFNDRELLEHAVLALADQKRDLGEVKKAVAKGLRAASRQSSTDSTDTLDPQAVLAELKKRVRAAGYQLNVDPNSDDWEAEVEAVIRVLHKDLKSMVKVSMIGTLFGATGSGLFGEEPRYSLPWRAFLLNVFATCFEKGKSVHGPSCLPLLPPGATTDPSLRRQPPPPRHSLAVAEDWGVLAEPHIEGGDYGDAPPDALVQMVGKFQKDARKDATKLLRCAQRPAPRRARRSRRAVAAPPPPPPRAAARRRRVAAPPSARPPPLGAHLRPRPSPSPPRSNLLWTNVFGYLAGCAGDELPPLDPNDPAFRALYKKAFSWGGRDPNGGKLPKGLLRFKNELAAWCPSDEYDGGADECHFEFGFFACAPPAARAHTCLSRPTPSPLTAARPPAG